MGLVVGLVSPRHYSRCREVQRELHIRIQLLWRVGECRISRSSTHRVLGRGFLRLHDPSSVLDLIFFQLGVLVFGLIILILILDLVLSLMTLVLDLGFTSSSSTSVVRHCRKVRSSQLKSIETRTYSM